MPDKFFLSSKNLTATPVQPDTAAQITEKIKEKGKGLKARSKEKGLRSKEKGLRSKD